MSKLVARFAENVFWVGRYLERAENLARILEINETYARDDPDGPDWKRVLRLYADLKRFESLHGEASTQAVLNYYVIDRDNPSSIVRCIDCARENARSIRHLISTEMWTQINIFRADVAALQKRDATVSNLSRVSREVIAGCQHFEGIAEGTFMRSEPWCFYQLGKYIERADQTTRILDIGYDRLSSADESQVAWVHWNVLLRSVSGYHAYRSRHPGASTPRDIAEFLLFDHEFPRAVGLCVNRVTSSLRDLARRHGNDRAAPAEAARRQIETMLEAGPGKNLNSKTLHVYLDRIQSALAHMSEQIGACYFLGR